MYDGNDNGCNAGGKYVWRPAGSHKAQWTVGTLGGYVRAAVKATKDISEF